MTFKDHFSRHSGAYARYRPGYPDALYDWLAARSPGHALAWDCATGTGQAARALASRFDRVIATDASARQIAGASGPDNVEFRIARAETSGLEAASADLVTVAQAVHWFDFDAFNAEVRRVLRPGGLVAVWTYTLLMKPREIGERVHAFAHDVVGSYWPRERRFVDDAYRDIPFPFGEIETPEFEIVSDLSLAEFLGYIGTWSAVARYRERNDADPVEILAEAVALAWGDPELRRRIGWPLVVRAGRV